MVIKIPISPGELIDKITILEIKTEFITDEAKLEVINSELEHLNLEFEKIHYDYRNLSKKINSFKKELYNINKKLWDTENKLRLHESKKEFHDDFIESARMVYKHNDKRAKLKREVNELLGSKISEIKSYLKY